MMFNSHQFKMLSLVLLTIIFNKINLPAQQNLYEKEKNNLSGILSKNNSISKSDIDLMEGYDIKFCKLDLNVTNLDCSISGTVTIGAKITDSGISEFVIELIDVYIASTNYMTVSSVKLNGIDTPFSHSDNLLRVNFNSPLRDGSYFSVEINYNGYSLANTSTEYSGLVKQQSFGTPILYSLINFFGAKYVFPCKQSLADKIDTLYTFITTNSDCKVASVGKLDAIITLPDNKTRYEWKSYYPIDYYLIYFSIAPYIEDKRDVLVTSEEEPILLQSFLIPDSPYLNVQYAAIDKTEILLQLYTELFGSYPFKNEKYGYAIIPSKWGAMEYQTLTMIGYAALDLTTSSVDKYSFWYTAHELGHSWFGDNVTPATFGDIWLSEGFASYIEYIAHERIHSDSVAQQWMANAMQTARTKTEGSVYVPESYWENEERILDYELEYKKGAILVHMIRNIINNDSLFFNILREFQTRYNKSTATAMQFKNVLEGISGLNFTDFFDQWFYGEGYPEFYFTWSQTETTLTISSVENTTSAATPLFKMPLEFKLTTASGDKIIRLNQTSNNETFYLDITEPVTSLKFDPNSWILARLRSITVDTERDEEIPIKFNLEQNYPNPFNPVTTIMYQIPAESHVIIKVYDMLGKEITTLVNSNKSAGSYELKFDARSLVSGVYYCSLQSGDFIQTKKLLLLK